MSVNGRKPVFYFLSHYCNTVKRKRKTADKPVDTEKSAVELGIGKKTILPRVWEIAEPLCDGEGIELVHIEYQSEPGGMKLRLYIDRPDGVTLDDCVFISRQLGDLLDVHLEITGEYNLEVSSPGPQRPLGKKSDYDKYKGKNIGIKTRLKIDGQKNFKGTLAGMSGNHIHLSIGEKTVVIPFESISKAWLLKNNGENGC